MSNITTIREVGQLTGGDQIKCMQVTVKAAYAPKKGSNEYGDWSIQPAMVEDSTGTIRMSFYDWPNDIRQLQGNTITITSGKDGKGHQSGIEALDYEDKKKNVVTRQVKVTQFATVNEVTGGSGDSSNTQPAPGPLPPGNAAPNVANQKQGFTPYVDEKKESIEKQVALREAVLLAGHVLNGANDQSIAPAYVINAAHRFYNEFFSAKPKPEPEPQPEQEAPKSEEKVI